MPTDSSRRERSEIDDWLAGRGALVMAAVFIALVISFILGFVHV